MDEKRINHEDVAGLVEGADYSPDEGICEIHDRSSLTEKFRLSQRLSQLCRASARFLGLGEGEQHPSSAPTAAKLQGKANVGVDDREHGQIAPPQTKTKGLPVAQMKGRVGKRVSDE